MSDPKSKESFEANPTLIADYLKLGYMQHLLNKRKSKMEIIVKITQDYADDPHKDSNTLIFNRELPRLMKEVKEVEKELKNLFKAENEGHGFTATLSKVIFWEAEE